MNPTKYAHIVEGKLIDFDGVYGSQCVDLVKDCIQKCFGITLGTFGGSARSGWYNKSNTFPSKDWERIENNVTNPNQVPMVGDVIFFDVGQYGHTGIVLKAYPGENRILILDQNTGNGDGKGEDDRIKIQEYTYKNVYGWFHYIMNITEYRGVPVAYSDDFIRQKGVGASYLKDFKRIIITSNFYKVPRERQEKVLEHEYSHHIYHSMPQAYRELWKLVSELKGPFRKYLKKYGLDYADNGYVTAYAKTSIEEDFAESIEEKDGKYTGYTAFKVKVANTIFNKFAEK